MLGTVLDSTKETLALIAKEKNVRKTDSLVLMFSEGSQFDHLIMLQLAKIGVFALVADPSKVTARDVRAIHPQGIIVSGGPASVHTEPPPFDNHIFDLGIPVLGICLGFQMWAKHRGATVIAGEKREFDVQTAHLSHSLLFDGIPRHSRVLQSHGDIVQDMQDGTFEVLAVTENSPVAAARRGHLWGVQFHPEVSDSEHGTQLFDNFCGKICGIVDRFPAHDVVGQKTAKLRKRIGKKKVLVLLSGGTDSSVLAHLLKRVTHGRDQLKALYIKGIDRPDDEAGLLRFFGNQPWIDVEVIDKTDAFLVAFKGITKPHEKRVAMRGVYVEATEEKIRREGDVAFVAQGTLYTDLVESGHGHATGARRAQIKLHHNVDLHLSVPELTPLDDCVKDTVRAIGRDLDVPRELLVRHPFPGPALLLRVEGEVTADLLRIARAADGIMMEELRNAGLYEEIWQAGARVMRSQHTTTKGDDAGSGCVIGWFAVSSVNGFTARAYGVPFDVRQRIADRMGNEIREVGATYFKDSGKPYSTIEAE